MIRTSITGLLVALWLAAPMTARAEAPAMVTTARGDVQLVTDGVAAELPPLPVLLAPGQSLQLGDGALAVVLCGGAATKLEGPGTVGLDQLRRVGTEAPAAPGVLADLLSRQTSTARPAASRGLGGELTLLRPVPWSSLLEPAVIRWHCEECGSVPVQVYDFRADEVVWATEGDGQVVYGGSTLKPGAYYLVVGGRDFPFTVPPAEDQARLQEALGTVDVALAGISGEGVEAEVARIGLEVGILMAAEMPTEALYRLDAALEKRPDDPDLKRLRTDVEGRAGLTP